MNPDFIGLLLRPSGPINAQRPRYRLVCPIQPNVSIVQYLGIIKEKNDKRWEWFTNRDIDFFPMFNKDKRVQGVAATREDALLKLLECIPQNVVIKLRLRNQGSLFEILTNTKE